MPVRNERMQGGEKVKERGGESNGGRGVRSPEEQRMRSRNKEQDDKR